MENDKDCGSKSGRLSDPGLARLNDEFHANFFQRVIRAWRKTAWEFESDPGPRRMFRLRAITRGASNELLEVEALAQ